jgi:hypothetical protein
MNLKQIALFITIVTAPLLYSCSGRSSSSGPGYLFQIILIVVPLFIIGHYLHKKIESANESLYVIEGQLRKLTTRIEALEEKLNEKTPAKRTKK